MKTEITSDRALDRKFAELTRLPVHKLVLRLAVPTIISMVVTALYNVADAAFVGHLTTEATAAVGVGFAYMTFIQAVGFFFGHGSGNHISRALGARQRDDASVMAAVGFFTPFLIGMAAAVVGLNFLPQLSVALGAPPEVVPLTVDYLRYILLASPFMMSALTLNNQLRLQGNARLGMVGLMGGAVLNIVLDPVFIFLFDMGVRGASMATAVSQVFSWSWLLWGTSRPESVHISFRNFRPSWSCYREIFAGGFPSLCRQAFNCVSAIMLNYAAARWSDPGMDSSGVAAFAVVSRTMMFAFSFVLGFCQGFQPVAGYNYGAHRYDRVRKAFHFTIAGSTVVLLVMSVAGLVFAPRIIALFRDEDPELIRIGTRALRWQCVAFPLIGVSTVTNMLFQNIRMPIRSALLSIGRQGLFFIPAILVLPQFFGLHGVEMTQAVADVCTFALSIPFTVWISRKLKRMASENL